MLFLDSDVGAEMIGDLVEERRTVVLGRMEKRVQHLFHAAVVVNEKCDRVSHAREPARVVPRRREHGSCFVRAGMTEAIGWLSSAVLLVTIGQQVFKQWHEGTSKGVSRWLFVGQMLASAGFTLYSWLVHNWVFVVTNALMLLSAILGYAIVLKHRRRERRRTGTGSAADEARDDPNQIGGRRRFGEVLFVACAEGDRAVLD